MNTEKLTLENIAPYLPYGLKYQSTEYWQDQTHKLYQLRTIYNAEEFGFDGFTSNWVKPILRTMDLTKPIIVEDKEIIPIVELAKIAIPNPSEEAFGGMNWFEYEGEAVLYDTGMESGYLLKYVKGCFILEGHDYSAYCPNQLALFKWLYANKFDVDGLIEKGLAIDATTLNINPYNS